MSDQLSMDGGLIISANYESRLHDGAVSTDFAVAKTVYQLHDYVRQAYADWVR